MDGSNTVLPHGAVVSEEFQWRNNRVVIPVRGSGTGAGFQRFCAGETHVQNASRPILEDERDLCGQHGIEYLELETALDGLAVIANPDNDWCESLTVEELAAIWESGSDVETWSDVRPDDPDFPDEEIELYGRDPASGTFDYFTEEITGEIGNIRSDYSASADTNVIVRGVRGSEYALGFGGAGYYYENEDELKLLGVDDGDGVVKPKRDDRKRRVPAVDAATVHLLPNRRLRARGGSCVRPILLRGDRRGGDRRRDRRTWGGTDVDAVGRPTRRLLRDSGRTGSGQRGETRGCDRGGARMSQAEGTTDITTGGSSGIDDRKNATIRYVFFSCALVTVLTTLGIILVLVQGSIEFFQQVSIVEYFTGTEWSPVIRPRSYGVLPLIWGRF